MARVSLEDISIRGISCCVPKKRVQNSQLAIFTSAEAQKFIERTGVEERRVTDGETCTSDLCHVAANSLLEKLNWKPEEVQLLVYVSQTGDYILPSTAVTLQERLGLSTECIAFDVPLGCSGYVYGLSIASGLMKSFGLKKGLLLAGDTISKYVSKNDKSAYPLFGDAASATALEYDKGSRPMFFELGSDGLGYKSIMISAGGSRNPISSDSLKQIEVEPGVSRNECQLALDGMEVFSFGITKAPESVKCLLDGFSLSGELVDYFVFHQANLMMNKAIARKLKLQAEKVPISLGSFGNTSSASIPLTIVTELREKILGKSCTLLLCGFGVGLSWGSVYLGLEENTIFDFNEL